MEKAPPEKGEARKVFDQNAPGHSPPEAAEQPPCEPVYVSRSDESCEARQLRSRIDRARAKFLTRAEQATSDDAGRIRLLASRIASEWTFKPATKEQLSEIVLMLAAMHTAANISERAEASNA